MKKAQSDLQPNSRAHFTTIFPAIPFARVLDVLVVVDVLETTARSAKALQMQMAELFGKDRTVIGRHIRNAIKEGEIAPEVACAKFAHTTQHGAKSHTLALSCNR